MKYNLKGFKSFCIPGPEPARFCWNRVNYGQKRILFLAKFVASAWARSCPVPLRGPLFLLPE
jgi:hypothetical protein